MFILPKALTDSMQFLWHFFHRIKQKILKFIENHKRPQIFKAIQRKRKKHIQRKRKKHSWRYHPPQFQSIFQSYSKQSSMVLEKKRYIEQWDKIESPEIIPHIYGQLPYDKVAKNIHGERKVTLTHCMGETYLYVLWYIISTPLHHGVIPGNT